MSRGLKAPFYPHEGRKIKDKHIRLTFDMMMSKNYLSLSASAKEVYSYMKLWACGNIEVDYSWKLASKYIGGNNTYLKAKDELIKKGFIQCVRTSKCSRLPNRYKFVSDWQNM